MGPIVAILIRLAVPVAIIRWPFGGMVAAIVADAMDVVIIGLIGAGDFSNYTSADKLLDTYMLAFAAAVSLQWENRLARFTSLALFCYRVAGVVVLEVTSTRWVLFVFPNLFELFFLYHLATAGRFRRFEVRGYLSLSLVLLLLLAVKMPQEYVLHVLEFGPWQWFHMDVLGIRSTI